MFASKTVDFEDKRERYGERRFICFGHLRGRMVAIAWTQRGTDRRVFSMRKANAREQDAYRERLGQS